MAGSGWIETTIGEQATLQRGIDITKASQRPGKVPVVSSGGISSYHDTFQVSAPSVVLGRKGVVGSVYYITEDYWPHDTTLWVKDFHNNDPRLVYYFFKSLAPRIARMDVGSANPTLNRNHVHPIKVLWPPLDEQKAIAHILGTLDDKIELNQQMNRTLEGIARALFKSWFIDFDPVRAKLDDRQPSGMDAETAALFPDAFEDGGAIGKIPKSWKVKELGDFVDIKHGYAFKGDYFRTEPPGDILLTPGNFAIGGGFKGDKLKYYDGPVPEEFVLEEGDLLVTMTDLSKASDTLGYPAFVPKPRRTQYLHNQRLGKVLINLESPVNKIYLYFLLRTDEYRHEVLASSSGTTVKHTSPQKIKAFKFPCPDPSILQNFEEKVLALHQKLEANADESASLTSVRDTLLPKLLSGEIRVKEAVQALEAVA